MEQESQRFFRRRNTKLLLLAALVVIGAAFAAYRYWHKHAAYAGVSRLEIDLRNPEMLLATRNLAQLPKDVAATPALAGLVDEELVFHYEEDEARLSIEGTLRRLAYEHDLDLHERFLATLLAAPAEVALWRAGKGRPEHFVATLERGALAKLSEALAKIALDDRQLKVVARFDAGGDEVTLYALAYGGGRNLAFASLGERWVFLSDPALALDEEGNPSDEAAVVLGDLLHGRHPWQAKLPHVEGAQHSFVVGHRALTLDYGHFLKGLSGLRFDHDGKAWQVSLRLDESVSPGGYDPSAIWRAMPLGAALCAALPVQWQAAAKPLDTLLGADPAVAATLAALDPVAAVCWYSGSRLSTPLFVARATKALPSQAPELLARLAEKAWSAAPEAGEVKGTPLMRVTRVPSVHGVRLQKGEAPAFHLALAQHGEWLFFSPDRRRVEAALAVAAKQAPALGDEPGLKGPGWLVLDPRQLSPLVRAEVQEVLPAEEESYFREIARNRLWPRLEAWGGRQQAVVAVPGRRDGAGFVSLDFKPLKKDER